MLVASHRRTFIRVPKAPSETDDVRKEGFAKANYEQRVVRWGCSIGSC